jgi:hypothetical protein
VYGSAKRAMLGMLQAFCNARYATACVSSDLRQSVSHPCKDWHGPGLAAVNQRHDEYIFNRGDFYLTSSRELQ